MNDTNPHHTNDEWKDPEINSAEPEVQRGREASDIDWKDKLTPEQFRVMREKGTEAPFAGKYVNEHGKGMYVCAACGTELFSSDTKFESGSGWPSFTDPANTEHVELHTDTSHGMERTEVTCKTCGAHLGHVFDDGPADKGGKRYCINSVCLELKPEKGEGE